MSLINTNHLVFHIFILILSTTSVALGSHHQHPHHAVDVQEVLRCLDHCDNTDVHSYFACQRSCELQHYSPEEEQHAGSSEPWSGTSIGPRWQQHVGQRTPEYEYTQCMHLCKEEEKEGPHELKCEQLCEERLRARLRKQDWEREKEAKAKAFIIDDVTVPIKSTYEECQKRCELVPRGQQRQLCRFRCRPGEARKAVNVNNHHQLGSGGDQNPYYFHSRRFRGVFGTEEGRITVLENFAERSELLRGIENYRLAVLEANPNTFIVPHHSDADYILFVAKGEGITIYLVQQAKRESHKLEKGDVIRVPAGTTMYLVNVSDKPIQIVKLLRPVNTPGSFEVFYPAGSEQPESYYTAFSREVLETALNTTGDQLERVFGQQRQGIIVRAREEQLRALISGVTDSSKKKKESRGYSKSKGEEPLNLLKQKPIYSNKFGQFFEVSPDDNKQLQDLGISVAFTQLNQGAMFLPHYNSKTATLVFVTEGSGRFEMVFSTQREYWGGEEGDISGRYQQVASYVSVGDVFVIPPGHPITIIASENENLGMVGFGINSQNNLRNFIAGKESVIEQIESEAKEIAFNVPSREIDRVFSNQQGSYFVAAAAGGQRRGQI